MADEELLRAAIAAFESAGRSFDAARLVLKQIVDGQVPAEPVVNDGVCRHRDAVEVTTMGDGAHVWLCPDCGDQFS